MNRRLSLPLPLQIALAGLVGFVTGSLLASAAADPAAEPWAVGRQAAQVLGDGFLAWTSALAWPLIASSIVLGTVGLEPMRALGQVTVRTAVRLAWHGLLAVGTGALAGFVFRPEGLVGQGMSTTMVRMLPINALRTSPDVLTGSGAWVAFVFLCLGLAYYRNQLEEGPGRLFIRFCQGLDEMLAPLLAVTNRLLPWAVFALLLGLGLGSDPGSTWARGQRLPPGLGSLLVAWTIFGLIVLPAQLWLFARVNPWRVWFAVLPAALWAFAGGSLTAALPLTLDAARRRLHVSSRVAGPVLSLGAAFQRDGLALGCAALLVYQWRAQGGPASWPLVLSGLAGCWLAAFGGNAVLGTGIATVGFVARWFDVGATHLLLDWALARLAIMGGAALGVFSQTCVAVIIAKGEGEYWVPGPPPDPDELQGLKNDLATAEG